VQTASDSGARVLPARAQDDAFVRHVPAIRARVRKAQSPSRPS